MVFLSEKELINYSGFKRDLLLELAKCSTDYIPGTVLSISHTLNYLSLTIMLCAEYYYYAYCTSKETEEQKLLKVT